MTNDELWRKAEALLGGLGATPIDVASFLASRGIRGVPGDPKNDPVCRWLNTELRITDLAIEFGQVFIISGDGRWWRLENHINLSNTVAVTEFLYLVDDGEFPELIDHG
jgi:hypothetical protein